MVLLIYAPWLGGYIIRAFIQPIQSLHWLWVLSRFLEFAINLWALIELGILRGTNGPNRFGPDPLAIAAERAAAFT